MQETNKTATKVEMCAAMKTRIVPQASAAESGNTLKKKTTSSSNKQTTKTTIKCHVPPTNTKGKRMHRDP